MGISGSVSVRKGSFIKDIQLLGGSGVKKFGHSLGKKKFFYANDAND